MEVWRGIAGQAALSARAALTLGNFDGLHLGHRKLIHETCKVARARGLLAVAMTFDPHPSWVLRPGNPVPRLYPVTEQIHDMAELGLDVFVVETFDQNLATLSADDFLIKYILAPFQAQEILIGYDFRFGAQRAGDCHFLRERSQQDDFSLQVLAAVELDGQVVSSTAIRAALQVGNVARAGQMLGQPYRLRGRVVSGDQRGRQLGYPTANVLLSDSSLLATGVYACRVTLAQGPHVGTYKGMANFGLRPTFQSGSQAMHPVLEVHIFDFQNDLYGSEIKVEFCARLRDERRFAGVAELTTQLKSDEAQARMLLD